MAYMNQDLKSQLAPQIKSVLKKHGIKGSISVRNRMVLVVNLKSGKQDIIQNWFDNAKNQPQYNDRILEKPEALQVSQYWIDNYFDGKVKEFFIELFQAMKGSKWYDNSDIMTDYFDTAYYMDVNVGQWNKPYQVEV
jgi:hypothetical protein